MLGPQLRQRTPHISIGQPKLPRYLRGLDPSLERGSDSVQLPCRQRDFDQLYPLLPHGRALRNDRLSTTSLLLGERSGDQSVEFLIVEMLDRAGKVSRQNGCSATSCSTRVLTDGDGGFRSNVFVENRLGVTG